MFGTTEAFSSFAVSDADAAKKFYSDVLGLSVEEMPFGMRLHITGGNPIIVYGKPDFQPATYTILNFPVGDLEQTVDALAERGVEFLRYEGFGQDERGIARAGGPPIAWFTDPAGNIFSVVQEQ
jgi:predicted enzyme related to lactoylglutathione lyase